MNKSVTTFVILPLASEEATAALESQKSESWKKTLSNVKSYAGVQLLNWGLQVENKKKMMLLIGKRLSPSQNYILILWYRLGKF